MHKVEIPCSIGAFNVAWKCLQLHKSWQSWINYCHDQNPCVHYLHQHIVWGREQVLEHPSSNGLAIEGIYQYMPSAHFVPRCWKWEVWTTWTGLSQNVHYCPLRYSYAYVAFNKSATATKLTNLWFPISCLEHHYLHSTFPWQKCTWKLS